MSADYLLAPDVDAIKQLLINAYDAKETYVESIIHLADSNLNKAIKLLAAKPDENFDFLKNMLRVSYKGQPHEICEVGEALGSLPKQALKGYLEYLLHFLRQCLLLNFVAEANVRLNYEELKFAKNFYSNLDEDAIQNLSEKISNKIYYIERNANTKLSMTNLCIQMHKLMKSRQAVSA